MEAWTSFLQERWYIILIAIVVLWLVIKTVKTVVKWVIVLALLFGLVYYGSNYVGKISLEELKTNVTHKVTSEMKEQALKAIVGEAKEAKYMQNPDGSYTVSTPRIKLDAKPGANEAIVTFLGQKFTLPIDSTLQNFVEQAKRNG